MLLLDFRVVFSGDCGVGESRLCLRFRFWFELKSASLVCWLDFSSRFELFSVFLAELVEDELGWDEELTAGWILSIFMRSMVTHSSRRLL